MKYLEQLNKLQEITEQFRKEYLLILQLENCVFDDVQQSLLEEVWQNDKDDKADSDLNGTANMVDRYTDDLLLNIKSVKQYYQNLKDLI